MPVAPDPVMSNAAATMAKVDALILDWLQHINLAPPSCSAPCATDLIPTPCPVAPPCPVPRIAIRPPKQALPCDIPRITADIQTTDDQLQLPEDAPFSELMRRGRRFDKSPELGGWYSRPPPVPLAPAKQAPTQWSRKKKGESDYLPRVRR